MIPALAKRGFGHGSGVWNPDSTKFLINVPKNASSFLSSWAGHQGWIVGHVSEFDTLEEIIVVLRDPVERWISGFCQYINTYIFSPYGPNGPIFPGEPVTHHDYPMSADMVIAQYSDVTERLIFDVISRFDDHTWPQCEIIADLPDCRQTFFYLDHSLESKLSEYLDWKIVPDLDRNDGARSAEIQKLQSFFKTRLTVRPELKERIQRHYAEDYALIRKVFS